MEIGRWAEMRREIKIGGVGEGDGDGDGVG
jgi:hypothetical protein